MASTAPPLPRHAVAVRLLLSAPGNRRVLSSLGFWSSASGRRPRARRLNARATATHLGGINHDVTYSGDDLTLVEGDLFSEEGPWWETSMAPHMNDETELSYLLGGVAANRDDWDILYDENPGITCINAAYCSEALGGEPTEGPPGEGEAHFFAGCDEYHEPLGMGLALYAFERDDARPGRAKTIAVFASEAG